MTFPKADVVTEDGMVQNIDNAENEVVVDPEQQRNNSVSSSFDRLVDFMYSKLPQELVDLIEDKVMEGLLCSGYMFHWKHDGNVIWEGRMYQAAQPEYLTLSKRIRDKYERRMQTENTYAIGVEDLEGVQRFPPPKDRRFIRKAHVHFDLGELDPEEHENDFLNPNPDRCSSEANCIWCEDDGCYKDGLWMKKNKYTESLELEGLTIDLRGCHKIWKRDELSLIGYANHWEWDGIAVARCARYFRFDHGVPPTLQILTNNDQEEQGVIQAIQDNSRRR
ncbi:MAG: hypothetical protein L6R42_004186 [Xanthoria sp. 1 TBL-2021]|nr:MAG: hypothetical protein L6R42_004186 [Xanthoria sp. 1 TBL-2021]